MRGPALEKKRKRDSTGPPPSEARRSSSDEYTETTTAALGRRPSSAARRARAAAPASATPERALLDAPVGDDDEAVALDHERLVRPHEVLAARDLGRVVAGHHDPRAQVREVEVTLGGDPVGRPRAPEHAVGAHDEAARMAGDGAASKEKPVHGSGCRWL